MISSSVALPLGFDPDELGAGVEIAGFVGRSHHHIEAAFLSFVAGSRAYVYRTPVLVAAPTPGLALLPSILGRDILNRWDMSYRPSRGRLSFDIVTADETIPIN